MHQDSSHGIAPVFYRWLLSLTAVCSDVIVKTMTTVARLHAAFDVARKTAPSVLGRARSVCNGALAKVAMCESPLVAIDAVRALVRVVATARKPLPSSRKALVEVSLGRRNRLRNAQIRVRLGIRRISEAITKEDALALLQGVELAFALAGLREKVLLRAVLTTARGIVHFAGTKKLTAG